MADVLGAARIVIRAIDGGVKRDLQRIMDQSAAQAGRRGGESMGAAFTRGFNKNARVSNVFQRISDGLNAVRPAGVAASEAFSSFVRRVNVGNAVLGAAVGAISAVIGGAGALAGALGGAGASLGILGGGIFSMIAAMVTGRLALSGMSEAVQKIREDGVNPFRGISESRADFADFIAGTERDLQSLRDAAADSFLPPLQRALETFFSEVIPTIRTGIAAVGRGMGEGVVAFMDVVARADNLTDLASAFNISSRLLASAGQALGNAWDAVLSIIVASGPITERYMNFIRDRLGQFASYLNVKQASGELEEFFNTSGNMAAQFGRILDNIFAGFGAIIMANFGPGTGGGYLLDWLEDATAKFAAMDDTMGSAAGLRDYFRDTAVNTQKIMSSIGALISELLRLGAMREIGEAFDILATGAPALGRMVEAGIEVLPVVAEIVVALFEIGAALAESGWDMAFFSTIRDIAQELSDFFRSELMQSILAVTGPILGQASAWGFLGSVLAGAFTIGVGGASRFFGALGDLGDALVFVGGDQGIRGLIRGLQLLPGASFTVAGQIGIAFNRVGSAVASVVTAMVGHIASTTIGTTVTTAFGAAAAFARNQVLTLGAALLKNPFTYIIAGIALAVAAFVAFYNTSEEFRTEVDKIWATIQEAFAGAGGGIADTIGSIGTAIAPLIPQIAGFFGSLISTVMPILGQLFTTIGGVFQQLLPVIGQVFSTLVGVFGSLASAIGPVIASLVSGLLPVFQSLLSAVMPVVNIFIAAFLPMFEQLAGVIGPVVEQLGGILLSTLAQLAPAVQPLIDAITGSLIPAWQNLMAALAPIIPMLITSLLPAFLMLVETVGSIVPTLVGMLVPAFVQLVNAILPVAITLIEILVPAFANLIEMLAPLVATLVGALLPVFAMLVEAVAPLVALLVEALVPVFAMLVAAIGPIVEALVGALVPIITLLVEVFANLLPILTFVAQVIATVLVTAVQILVNILAFLIPVIVPIAEVLANILVVAIQVVVAILTVLVEIIAAVINWFAGLATGVQTVVGIIGPAIANVMTWISDSINNAMTFIQNIWDTVWNAVVAVVTAVWNAILTAIQTAINFVLSVIQTVLNVISTIWNAIWTAIFTVVSNIWNGIIGFISGAINNVMNVIRGVLNTISSIWSSIWNAIASVVSGIWNNIMNGISNTINGIRNVISTVMNAVASIWSNIWNGIASTFRGIWNGITGAISGLSGIISGAFNGMVGIIKGAINGVIGLANSAIRALNGISVSIPDWVPGIGGSTFGISIPTIPRLAKGGTVMPSPGGTLAQIAEAGRPERVEPLDPSGLSQRDRAMIDMLAGPRGEVTIQIYGAEGQPISELAEAVARELAWMNRH